MRITRAQLRRIIREALEQWNPAEIGYMFDDVALKHMRLRTDPQIEPFVKRGGPMTASFEALQAGAKIADMMASAPGDDSVEDLRLEAQDHVTAARDALLQMQDSLGGHRKLQDLIGGMGDLIAALDPHEYPDVPRADVGDMYDPL